MAAVSLEALLQGRRSQPHQLIEVLQDVQESQGYISEEAMGFVSKELGVPPIEVFRVANFYKAFSLVPHGKHTITVCTGTACHVRGSNLLMHEVLGHLEVAPGETTPDGLFTVECVNCLGACALAPVVVLDGSYHPHMTPRKFRRLVQTIRKSEHGETAHVAS